MGKPCGTLIKSPLQTFNTNITTQIDMDGCESSAQKCETIFFWSVLKRKIERDSIFMMALAQEMGRCVQKGCYSTVIKAGNIAKVLLYAGLNENSERTCTNLQITPGTTAPTTYTPYIGQSNSPDPPINHLRWRGGRGER